MNIHATGDIPSTWREVKIIAILKSGKHAADQSSYRPISLLCTTSKWFEYVLLARFSSLVEPNLDVCWQTKMLREFDCIKANPELPFHEDLQNLPNMRLNHANPSGALQMF